MTIYFVHCPFCPEKMEVKMEQMVDGLHGDDHPVGQLFRHIRQEHPDEYQQEQHFRLTAEKESRVN